jgi:hypothetical protein
LLEQGKSLIVLTEPPVQVCKRESRNSRRSRPLFDCGQPASDRSRVSDCRYDGRNPLWFRIYYDGSANDATTLFAKRKVFHSPKTAASGIGDEAYFDKGGALHARKGNVRFYLDIGTDKQEPAVTKLGAIVAGQL